MDPVPISELIIELIAAIGVGPFILVVFVLLIVGLAPTIINRLFDMAARKRAGQELETSFSGFQKQLNLLFNVEEKVGERIDNLNKNVNSIQEKMRNVMSEDDIIRFASVKLGVEEDFKTRLLKGISKILDKTNGHLEADLRLKIKTEWQSLKNDLYSLNAPINLKEFINSYDEMFSEHGTLFLDVKETIDDSHMTINRKKSRIAAILDSTLIDIRNDLSSKLKR